MNRIIASLLLCCTCIYAPLASAHHAWPVSRAELVTVQGTVTDFDWSNPHPMITIDVQAEDGTVQEWNIGGPAINRMEARGWNRNTVKAGDVITGTGYQFSNGNRIIRLERATLADGTELLVYARQ